jgi:hypothetical protein
VSLASKRRRKALYKKEARQLANLKELMPTEEYEAALIEHYGWPPDKAAEAAKLLRDFSEKIARPNERYGLRAPRLDGAEK